MKRFIFTFAAIISFSCISFANVYLENNWIGMNVTDSPDDFAFDLGTSSMYAAYPDQSLLYYYYGTNYNPAGSSHIVLNIDNTPYDYTSATTVTMPAVNGNAITGVQNYSNKIELTIEYSFVVNPSTGVNLDTMQLKLTAKNISASTVTLAGRVELDTMVAGNDGTNISVDNGNTVLTNDTAWYKNVIMPANWCDFDQDPHLYTPKLVARSYLRNNPFGTPVTQPDIFEIADYNQIYSSAATPRWTLATPSGAITTDSAVVYWFTDGNGGGPSANITLAPGASTTWVIDYGLSQTTLLGTPTCTQTSTPTDTVTVTPVITETVTQTSTCTITQTMTMTATTTITKTTTLTATPTGTPTAVSTGTLTATQTDTNTCTMTIASTQTASATKTVTASWTITRTATSTSSETLTVTGTATSTKTGTMTTTRTMTVIMTATGTFTRTMTPTAAATRTPASANLEILLETIDYSTPPGGQIRAKFTVHNSGATAANNVIVWDSLPVGAAFAAGNAENLPWSLGRNGIFALNAGTIAPGATVDYYFTLTAGDNLPSLAYVMIVAATVSYTDPVSPANNRYAQSRPAMVAVGDILIYPNPFNPHLAMGGTLKFANLPVNAVVTIYTISAEMVISFSPQAAYLFWNGNNMYGKKVSPGIYYYCISWDDFKKSIKGKIFIVSGNS